MSVRVCPICDKRMKYAHFCTNCKVYIKEPAYWDRIYNLNGYGQESTIVNQCDNHDHSRENATGKVRSNYNMTASTSASVERQKEQKRAEKMRQIEQRRREHQRNEKLGEVRQQNASDKKLKKKKSKILTIIFIYIMIQVLLPMIVGIASIFFRL